MKMKQACHLTNLTERAVRLYLAKGLLAPKRKGGIIEFSSEDIQLLRDIAFLRHNGFTIAQIYEMQTAPATISSILNERQKAALTAAQHEQSVHDSIDRISSIPFEDIHTFIIAFKSSCAISVTPVFGGMLDETPLNAPHSRTIRHRSLACLVLSILLALLLITAAFLSYTRISGSISMPQFSITNINKDRITIQFIDEAAVQLFGQDSLTLPYHAFGAPLQPGTIIKNGCQLAVSLTNYDLLKLSVHPLYDFNTPSIEVNNAWRSYLLQRMISRNSTDKHVMLWIREISNQPPLFQ